MYIFIVVFSTGFQLFFSVFLGMNRCGTLKTTLPGGFVSRCDKPFSEKKNDYLPLSG
jgi:hypothetical protein